MILDNIENFSKYISLHPLFGEVAGFLAGNDLASLPLGVYRIKEDDVFVNVVESDAKTRDEAVLESHRRMIDIQIPISHPEWHGHLLLDESITSSAEYDENKDISFYGDITDMNYLKVKPGEFVVYFPNDGHAPAISETKFKKAIFKVSLN